MSATNFAIAAEVVDAAMAGRALGSTTGVEHDDGLVAHAGHAKTAAIVLVFMVKDLAEGKRRAAARVSKACSTGVRRRASDPFRRISLFHATSPGAGRGRGTGAPPAS